MVIKLPPVVKQLLTLRNPSPLSIPSISRLHATFTDTFATAQSKNAETAWLVLMTCALTTKNMPSSVSELYRFASMASFKTAGDTERVGLSHKIAVVEHMRESALKSVIFIGVPRIILTLSALNGILEDEVKSSLRSNSLRQATPQNTEATLSRGRALWNSIYAPHADKLHDKLGSYHPDFITFIIHSYGSILAPIPVNQELEHVEGNLSRALSSVVGVACLRAEERVGPQLVSHVFGLLKARSTTEQTEEDVWLSTDEGAEWVIRTVDAIVDAVAAPDSDHAQVKL